MSNRARDNNKARWWTAERIIEAYREQGVTCSEEEIQGMARVADELLRGEWRERKAKIKTSRWEVPCGSMQTEEGRVDAVRSIARHWEPPDLRRGPPRPPLRGDSQNRVSRIGDSGP